MICTSIIKAVARAPATGHTTPFRQRLLGDTRSRRLVGEAPLELDKGVREVSQGGHSLSCSWFVLVPTVPPPHIGLPKAADTP